MLFNTVFLAFVASAVTVSALPSTASSSKLDARDPQNRPFNPFFRQPQHTQPHPVPAKSSPPKSNNAAVKGGSNKNQFNNKPSSKPAPNKFKARKPKKTPTKMWFQPGGVPRRNPQQNQNQFRGGKGRGGKGKNNNGGKGNNNNNNSASSTTTAADAGVTDPPQLDDGAAQDTGITDVVEFCLNGDGKTSCFEILGDSKDSCFTIPNPIANNAAFFLPPPKDTCELFTDVDCTSDPTPALGAISNVKQLAWSCLPTANVTSTTTDAATTTTSANNAVATGGNNDNNDAPQDTGITNVIEGCLNPDGKTKCFEILADTLESCFTLPNPLANNVAFWLPMPNATCTLFSDEDCTKNAFPNANGPIDDIKRNSWSCVPA